MYRWVDHTGELELELEAGSQEAVFADALKAVGDLLGERAGAARGEPATRAIAVAAGDRGALLAAWLSEVVYLAESQGFVPEAVERLELGGDGIKATVSGRHGSPPHLIKAVTYHRLGMWEEDGGWRARVVLDV